MALLILASLASIVTFVRQTIISRGLVWWVLFLEFPTTFLCIKFLYFRFTVIDISRQIRFLWLWVWQWWVWFQVRWYVRFPFSFWIICWACWRLCWSCWQLRWSCLWCGVWHFCSDQNRVNWWRCFVGIVRINRSRFQSWSTHWNILAPKLLIFPPNFKISFIDTVLLWTCRAHSNLRSFTKEKIRGRPMGSIHQPSDSGSGSTKGIEFIWCVDSQDPQIHETWCLGSDGVDHKFHPTVQIDDSTGTVGQFKPNTFLKMDI